MTRTQDLVSFVVLSWNTLEDTKTCLENIRRQDYQNIEIVVVDNGSDDGSKDYLASVDDITYVDLPKNTGFTGGQIAALPHCNGSYVVLLNSDAVLATDWTSKALGVVNSDKTIAAVGGKVFEWNESYKINRTDSPFYSYQKIDLELGYASTLRTGERRVEVDSISGAAVMISRQVIEKIGYFDNHFFAYFEETDLFARFQRAGYKIIYEPSLHAWHQIAKSSRSKPYFYLYHMHRNRFMFAFKNFDHPWRFAIEYGIDFLKARRRYSPKNDAQIDEKARIDAFWWNITRLPKHIVTRRKAKSSLPHRYSYDNLVRSHRPGDDVTIVIPSYNYVKYLAETIESAINQTHTATRILIIDDGSKDDSVKLAKSYKNVEVIAKENEGVIATKNLGIQQVSTSWTVFLDADDVMPPNYLEELLKESHKQAADVVYCDMEYFGSKSEVFRSIDFSAEKLAEGNFIHNSALINTSLLKSVGGYKPIMKGGYEDWELYLTLAQADARFAYCRDTHLKYRQHGDSLSRNNEAMKSADKLLGQVRELHAPLYSSLARNKLRSTKIRRMLMKHPELPFIALLALPVAALLGVKVYIKGVRSYSVKLIRTYLHKRDSPSALDKSEID